MILKRNYKTKESAIRRLQEYLAKLPGLVCAYIFGSFGTIYQTDLSDIDIALLFHEKKELMVLLAIEAEISSIFEVDKIDLIDLNSAPVLLCHKIISEGEKIYDSSTETVSDFIEKILETQHDYIYTMYKFFEDFEEGIKKER